MSDYTAQAIWVLERLQSRLAPDDFPARQAVETAIALLLAAAEQREALDECEEKRIMQLTACSTASIQNTPATRQERLPQDHPYWSVAYSDVCRAIDREIALREQLDAGRRGPQQEECILPDKHPLRIRAEKAEARIEQACFSAVQNATNGTIVGSFESLAEILKGEPHGGPSDE